MWLLSVTKALNHHKVRYAIVGGYAVALHGATRGTIDIDIVIPREEPQFEAAQAALESIGLRSKLPVDAREVFQFREEYIKNRNMIAWTFINTSNRTHIIDIIITEDLNTFTVKTVKIKRQSVNIASASDLIKMKSKSSRDQDLADIDALRRLQ